jgi:hypothetical protein
MSARPAANDGEGVVPDVDAPLVHDTRRRIPTMNDRRICGWYVQRGLVLRRGLITREDRRRGKLAVEDRRGDA